MKFNYFSDHFIQIIQRIVRVFLKVIKFESVVRIEPGSFLKPLHSIFAQNSIVVIEILMKFY